MRKSSVLFLFVLVLCSSFTLHKFYMAIYQVNHNVSKKRLEITARIFVDDLNTALDKKYKTKHFLGTDKQTPTDTEDLKKYLLERLKFTVNNQTKPITFKSAELEGNVLVCYLNCVEVPKVTQIDVQNLILTDSFDEQENMMHFQFNGTKHTLVLDAQKTKGMLK
ncbi:MAG: hypothetical protein RLZZ500_68 [Bacteroidota bacterium]